MMIEFVSRAIQNRVEDNGPVVFAAPGPFRCTGGGSLTIAATCSRLIVQFDACESRSREYAHLPTWWRISRVPKSHRAVHREAVSRFGPGRLLTLVSRPAKSERNSLVRGETQMVEKCCGSKWLVSIATGGHSDMTTSIGTKRARNVFLPVIAVDSHHAQAKCAPLRRSASF
jgi:hypothetical protein